ncbi:MAG TPA: MFS transporter [Actinomycetota bacterium]|nr:MFS transporter [Actinomycetota bacterium]
MGRAGGIRAIVRVPEIRAALVGTFVIMLGFGILYPILPLYARSFGVGYEAVGVLAASFALTRLATDLVAGRAVDRIGERRAATLGALVVGASSAAAALAPTFALLVAFRAAGGAGSALFFAAMLSYLLKVAPEGLVGRVMGVYFATFNLGFIAGPPVGGLVAAWLGLAAPLWIYAASCLAAAALYRRSIRDPVGSGAAPDPVRGWRRLRWDRAFVAALVANGAQTWMVGGVYSTLVPLFGRDRVGLDEVGVSLAIAVASATEFLALYPAGAVADRVGRKAVLAPSLAVIVVVLLGLARAVEPAWFLAALGLLGAAFGAGGVAPAAMLSDLTPAEASGTATGVFRFVGDLGFVLGPLAAGASADALGLGTAFALTGVPCALALLLLLGVRETLVVARDRRHEETGL